MDKPSKQNLETEQQLIHLMLKSRSVIEEVLDDGLSPDLFDPYHRPLVECIFKEFSVSHGKRRLSRESYRQMLLDQNFGGDMLQNMGVYDACFAGSYAKLDDLGHLKKALIRSHLTRSCYFFIEDFEKEEKKLGIQVACQNLSDKLQSSLGVTETRRSEFVSLPEMKEDFIEELKQQAENPDKVIKCDIPEIDDAINVGFRPQHLTLVIADVGMHKTNLMLNISLNLYDRGHSVLFIPLEMPYKDLLKRIVANRADVHFDKLTFPSMLQTEEWKRIKECNVWFEHQHKFCLLDSSERSSVSQIQREIEKRAMIFKPEVVIIDYIANLRPDVRYGERNDLEIGEILKSLRFLGRRYGFHILSAAQMGRSAIKALQNDPNAVPDSTSIRGSHEYSADSDTIFGLLKVKDEPNRLKVARIKARHGPSGGGLEELHVDPTKCRITSTKQLSNIASSIGSSDEDLEWTLNQPVSQISEEIESKPAVSFVGLDLDSEDEIGCLG